MMRPVEWRRRLAGVAVFLLVPVAALQLSSAQAVRARQAPAAPATPLTIDWVFGPEGRSVASVPGETWLDNGTALILDNRRPVAERTVEVLDPQTGARRPAVDMPRAVASLRALGPETASVITLPPPDAVDLKGRYTAYIFGGDIFLLDMASAQFARVTATSAEEECVEFSPDGRKLSFVRANDLFVYDTATKAETRLTRDGSETMLNGTLSWVYWEEIFGRRDIGYWWAPDSSAIAYLQTDESPVEASLFVDFQPAMPRVIRQRYPKAGFPNPRVRTGIVEIGREQPTWIRIDDRPFEYLARVKWLPDSRRVSVQTMTRDHTELNLYFADRATGAASRILTETDPAWVNITDDLYFLKSAQFLWGSERTGFLHLYRYGLDGTLVNPVTSGEWAMASSGGGVFWLRQAVTGIDEQNGWAYFTSNQGASIERQLYRVKLDGRRRSSTPSSRPAGRSRRSSTRCASTASAIGRPRCISTARWWSSGSGRSRTGTE